MSSNSETKINDGIQFVDSNNSFRNDYMDYVSHLQNSATQLRYENNVLKNDNLNLVAKLDRLVSKSRNGVTLPENVTTADISEAFQKLNEENCQLKREMERLIRSNTRYKVALQNKDPSLISSEENENSISSDTINGNLCQCEYILNEILEAVSYKLETYEKHIWEHRITTLTNERDEIAVQNISLVDRLAEIEAIIKVDHVLAERFNVPLEGCDDKNQILNLHRKLGFALDVNQQLERRLAFETQLSRSWQSNMHTIVSELRQYLYELGAIIKQSNGCEIFRSINNFDQINNNINSSNINSNNNTSESVGFRKTDRESLKLLRLAKQRIEADTKRLETCNRRIVELENEVASLRVRNHSFIYSEGAIDRNIVSKEMMRSILPPPKDISKELTNSLVNTDKNLFGINNLSTNQNNIINVESDRIENQTEEKKKLSFESSSNQLKDLNSKESLISNKSEFNENLNSHHHRKDYNQSHRSHQSNVKDKDTNNHHSQTQSLSQTHRSHKSTHDSKSKGSTPHKK